MKPRVIVIGAGSAGLTAAIAAAKAGADVTVLSKSRQSSNTSTLYSGGIFTLPCGGVAPEEHLEKTLQTGRRLNDLELARTLSSEAAPALKQLEEWGVGIRYPRPGMASVKHSARHKMMGGEGFLEQLNSLAGRSGVRFMEEVIAVKILAGSRAEGVRALNWHTGVEEDLPADAVVLASGGAGQIFSRTDNPARMTGDGYALARDLGLPFRDMEFIQFYPLGWADPGLPVWMADLSLIDMIPMTDSRGREFLLEELRAAGLKNGAEANLYARDLSAVLIEKEARRGGAFLHFEKADEELRSGKPFIRALMLSSAQFRNVRRPVATEPLEHYFCGGVCIDPMGRTALEGLFACGEVTGGVDGANRVGGNSLANTVVFGLRAGRAAAESPARGKVLPIHNDSLHCTLRQQAEPRTAHRVEPQALRRELQSVMWRCLGPVRNEAGLKEALSFLESRRDTPLNIRTPRELLEAQEMKGLFTAAELAARAALARRESCGTHYRED